MDKKEDIKKYLKANKKLLKKVVEVLFTFGELNRGLGNIDHSVGNFNCPFHPAEGQGENRSKSARAYFNEEQNIYIIRCFTTQTSYTVFNYIEMVMEKDPCDYLLDNKNITDILDIVNLYMKGYLDLDNNFSESRRLYIDNLFAECEYDVVEYIQRLYVQPS